MSNPNGRPPKPAALRILDGDKVDRIEPTPAPAPVGVMLAVPESLNEPERAVWNYLAPILLGMGLFTQADRHALSILCRAVARCDALAKQINSIPLDKSMTAMMAKNADGSVSRGSWANELLKWQREAGYWFSRFGLTPIDRARLAVKITDADDGEMEGILNNARR